MTPIFVSANGQDDNIGDSGLRRGLLDALRPAGDLHVFVGAASDDYVAGLGLAESDTVYSARLKWRARLLREAVRRRAGYAFNAGEITPSAKNGLGRVLATADALVVRLAGGGVVHTGLGLRRAPGFWRRVAAPSLALAHVITWRDAVSQKYIGRGTVAPDWGFAEGTASSDWQAERTTIALVLRADRPAPTLDEFARAVADAGYSLTLVVQVRKDNARAAELARQLGADLVPFTVESHLEQEEIVRTVYRRSAAVVGDRLHALIFGATEGAVPIGLASNPEKLSRTLAPAALDGTIHSFDQLDDLVAPGRLKQIITETPLREAVDSSRAELRELAARVQTTLGG